MEKRLIVIENIRKFLSRVQLTGVEVEAYVEVLNELTKIEQEVKEVKE